MNIKITGSGSYIPSLKVTNQDFSNHEFLNEDGSTLNQTNEIIAQKFTEITGIIERRYVQDNQITSEIATIAAQKAIEDAKNRFKDPFWHNEAGKKQLKAFLRNRMRELPENFETREIGKEKWLYYSLNREPTYPTHHYCHILDERFYLDIFFHYRIDFRKYFPIWKDHAEAAEQRIMDSVRLHFPDRLQEAQEFIPKK